MKTHETTYGSTPITVHYEIIKGEPMERDYPGTPDRYKIFAVILEDFEGLEISTDLPTNIEEIIIEELKGL